MNVCEMALRWKSDVLLIFSEKVEAPAVQIL